MAITNAQAYAVYKGNMGGSDPVRTCATKRSKLPLWNDLPPEVHTAFTACMVGPPATGQAAYGLYLANINAAEPFPKTIMGLADANIPIWSGLLPIQQAAWNAVRAAMVA